MSSTSSPLRVAVAGIGGFGASHQSALLQLEEEEKRVKVIAACDPALDRLESAIAQVRLHERGVALYRDFNAMLEETAAEPPQIVTVAAPIPLHALMHSACVERGIACYMEKPPTLNPEELEQMIERDREAAVPTEVGFNYIYQPYRHALKERVLAGEFGAIRRISFRGLWPRAIRYYQRNGWAGRLLTDEGTITLDSCCGNAMAHHVHNVLFFGGTGGINDWGIPQEIEAELYRANDIQGTDTIFCRGRLENGVELRIAASHACPDGSGRSWEIIECEDATITIAQHLGELSIARKGAEVELHPIPNASLLDNLRLYTDLVRGERDRPSTLLSDCRGFVRLNALFYLAARQITPVSAVNADAQGVDVVRQIEGIEEATACMVETGELPSEQRLGWAVPGGRATKADVPQLRAVLEQLIA